MTSSGASAQTGDKDTEPDLGTARRVLRIEAEGLEALARSIGAQFFAALDLISGLSGRVVVTGMGKSGHVARKIASTLASTGMPAFFVHPAEASHGDLGMIVEGDALLALSNSGETSELVDLVDYAKRFNIPIICMTSSPDGALAEASEITLLLPDREEACPMGLAPTTSTTMMMALGDALSVALLERKGFSAEDFHALHPGGKLGSRLLKVSDLMHDGDELPLASADVTMADALIVMTAKSFGCVGIVDEAGALLGIVTDGDLRRHMSADLIGRRAADVMTVGPTTIRPDALASEAVQIMNSRAITNLFVMRDAVPVGILHIHDCLRAGVA
ncbi:MAG: KpsF/GutQ family sugar-phosphate isomerase [Rhodospirillales bacterium]|nr:KpsF/GutQ family sugar-phosphate isomerase [Rhodospirillales bacterium]